MSAVQIDDYPTDQVDQTDQAYQRPAEEVLVDPHTLQEYEIHESSTEEAVDELHTRDAVQRHIDRRLSEGGINERDARVVKRMYGLGDTEQQSMEQIGKSDKVTPARVRQLGARGIRGLRVGSSSLR
jgi:DNA-directed RNA polymerase sigma subunit (sigma70/sigma32)